MLSNVGTNYFYQKQYKLAEKAFKESLTMRMRLYGHDGYHVDIARILCKLGTNCMDQRKYKAAERYYKQSLFIYKKVHGADGSHRDIAKVFSKLSNNSLEQSIQRKSKISTVIVVIFLLIVALGASAAIIGNEYF